MNPIPQFGDTCEAWFVLGKASVQYGATKAEPRSFHVKLVWVLQDAESSHDPGWLLVDLRQIPHEYLEANRYMKERGYSGVKTEQEAWSNYMRHIEHEMASARDGFNARMQDMQNLSDAVRNQWIKVQTDSPIAGLVPPVLSPDRKFSVR